MNKLNFVQKLPIGFRFEPTDEEIVFQYLVRKVFSYPLPSLIIPEILFNIFSLHPSQLPAGDSDQDSIAFSGNNRAANCNIQQKTNFQGSLIQIGNWVLCHMFLKKRSSTAITISYDSMEDDSSDSDSSSLTDEDVSSSTNSVNDGN
ncbi:hypothetical protein RD792_008836 [Penstemon davidsonii]|uniref:NAC domain-containing protein n=1 Tax=Penstemon davidsonii TaxID=160366 RepID=A0ABR0DAH4_9LAMI|nr:hypothetical protein RD792_008836 [Penstemon davidsonii]